MNGFVDFHTHLDSFKDEDELFSQLSGFDGVIVAASMNLSSFYKIREIRQKSKALGYKVRIVPTLGVHPANVLSEIKNLSLYKDALKDSAIIGEIGMDFCWYKDATPAQQEEVFRFFLEHCAEHKKYCVIHTKDAEEKICRILEDYRDAKPIIHWYDGPEEVYKEFILRGYMQTFGCETIRSEHLQKLLLQTPLNLILAETDGPDSEKWLGGTDDSLYLIKRTYRDLAQVLGMKAEEIQKTINENSNRVLTEAGFDFSE